MYTYVQIHAGGHEVFSRLYVRSKQYYCLCVHKSYNNENNVYMHYKIQRDIIFSLLF